VRNALRGFLQSALSGPVQPRQTSTRGAAAYKPGRAMRTTLRAMQPLDDQRAAVAGELRATGGRDYAQPECSFAHRGRTEPASGTRRWSLLRECVRARRALLNLRLRDASRSIGRMRGILSACDPAFQVRYEPALAALRAAVLLGQDDLPRAHELLLTFSQAAREGSFCKILLRYVDWLRGEAADIPEPAHYADSATCEGRSPLERILTLCVSAALEFEHLRPIIAANLAAEALRIASERYGSTSSVSTLPAVLLAQVAYEQGRLTEAEALIRPRMTAILSSGTAECVRRACILLARISVHRGQSADAHAWLRQVEAIARSRGWRKLLSALREEQARVLSSAAHVPSAATHASRYAQDSSSRGARSFDVLPQYSSVYAALARLASTSSPLSAAERHALLISCLRIGANRGLYRLFVDAGAPVMRLLRALYEESGTTAHAHDLHAYIGLLLRAADTPSVPIRQRAAPAHQPLSRREQTILEMIAQGLSNKRIAQSLGIAPETVKSHAKSIFAKLGTRTRAEAVARAASIGLPYGAELALGLTPA